MTTTSLQSMSAAAWALARKQHWTITYHQLRKIGYTRSAIRHRVATGRLHELHDGVFAVGRPALGPLGRWKAAELSLGGEAGLLLDHAAALWGMTPETPLIPIAVGVPLDVRPESDEIIVHRRCARVMREMRMRSGIRVTSPVCTLVDLAHRWDRDRLESAISEADKHDIVRADDLRRQLERLSGVPGVAALRKTLDRQTFRLSDSRLERVFRPFAKRAGLETPDTQKHLGSGRVDFVFPRLGLVVETDGLRYHRTAAQQNRDLRRDQQHAVAGRERLRFSHAQIYYEREYVEGILAKTRERLEAAERSGGQIPPTWS